LVKSKALVTLCEGSSFWEAGVMRLFYDNTKTVVNDYEARRMNG